jgi:hypothetical protein
MFSADVFKSHYRRHVNTLTTHHENDPTDFHHIMSSLFKAVAYVLLTPQMLHY